MFSAFTSTPKTVNDVLATFNKAIDDLEAVEREQGEEVARQAGIVAEAQAKLDAAKEEAQRAAAVGKRFKDLLSTALS